jgi:acetyl-CoA carboxylase biotin carboxyl carrier protein
MAENPGQSSGPLDVKSIHQLVRLMKRYDMTAIDLVDGDTRIRLRRRGPEAVVATPATAALYPPTAPAASPQATTPPPTAPAATSTDNVIESPMVGTYYASPSPDSPPFVTVGSSIRPETTVCVIEAMKVFTDIPAGVSGTVTEILVKNGQPVEFGQPLFRVRPS